MERQDADIRPDRFTAHRHGQPQLRGKRTNGEGEGDADKLLPGGLGLNDERWQGADAALGHAGRFDRCRMRRESLHPPV